MMLIMRRKISFAVDSFYHVYTRGIDGREIFPDASYFSYFLALLKHCLTYSYPYSTLRKRLKKAETAQERRDILSQLEEKRVSQPVQLVSFCLMPTHPHLTLKQVESQGITNFMHRVLTSYSRYFNIRQQRKGSLYESVFKSVKVESTEQLIHLSRYQHLNPTALGLASIDELKSYPWSSLLAYLGEREMPFVEAPPVLSHFADPHDYAQFLLAEVDEYEPLRLEVVAIDDDFGWFASFGELKKRKREMLRERFEALEV